MKFKLLMEIKLIYLFYNPENSKIEKEKINCLRWGLEPRVFTIHRMGALTN